MWICMYVRFIKKVLSYKDVSCWYLMLFIFVFLSVFYISGVYSFCLIFKLVYLFLFGNFLWSFFISFLNEENFLVGWVGGEKCCWFFVGIGLV